MGAVSELVRKYSQYLPPDVRVLVEELGSKLVVETESEPPSLRLGEHVVMLPKDMSLLNYSVELLLRRAGCDSKLGDKLPTVVMVLTQAVREAVEKKVAERVVSIEVRHVTEREELYYGIVKQIMNEYKIKTFYVRSSNGESEVGIHCFDGVAYRPCEKEIIAKIEELASVDENISMKTTRWVINEAVSKIKRMTLTPLRYEPMMIAFKNIVFDWENYLRTFNVRASVMAPDPETVVFHKIPHELPVKELDELEGLLKYDESLVDDIEGLAEKFTPKTLKAFKEWVGDKWMLLYEILGAVLIPKPIKKAFLLIGETDTGKSTYIRLLQKLIGRDNYTSVSLQELVNREYRFRASRIYRKLANFYPDLPSESVRDPNAFKVITGEDVIVIERKHKEPFEWLPYTKHIFSANEPPPVYNADRAFWNRWLVVEFIGRFEKKIKNFEEMLLGEAPYTLLLGIISFGRVVKRGWMFSFENTPEDAKRKWMMSSDSVYAFIMNMLEDGVLVEDPNGRIKTSELYDMYTKWCSENDMNPIDHRAFPNRIRKVMGYQIKRTKHGTYVIGLRKSSQCTLTISDGDEGD